MKVYELAKEIKVSNNQIKIACGALGKPVKSHLNELDSEMVSQVKEYILNADPEDLKPEKKEMTKPWSDKPWSVDMLRLRKEHKGFHSRFVDKDKVQGRLEKGYAIANAKDYGELSAKLPGEEAQKDSVIRRRELILMEIPIELKKERDKFIDWKSNKRAKDARKMAENKAKQIENQTGIDTRFKTSSKSSVGY